MAFCGFNSWQVKQGLFPCFRSPKNMLFNTFFPDFVTQKTRIL